jgi:hypothetical protein
MLRFQHGVLVADPSLPINDGARIALNLPSLGETAFGQLCQTHAADMHDNAYFPAPTPSEADFATLLAMYWDALTTAESAQNAAKAATATKNTISDALATALRHRAAYVQIASNGNTVIALSSGLPLKKTRSPKGVLPSPENIRITLSSVAGEMLIQWDIVEGNDGYLIRSSPDTLPRDWTTRRQSKRRLALTDLDLGTAYVFQIATAGGEGGQGPWSPEVRRTAG